MPVFRRTASCSAAPGPKLGDGNLVQHAAHEHRAEGEGVNGLRQPRWEPEPFDGSRGDLPQGEDREEGEEHHDAVVGPDLRVGEDADEGPVATDHRHQEG